MKLQKQKLAWEKLYNMKLIQIVDRIKWKLLKRWHFKETFAFDQTSADSITHHVNWDASKNLASCYMHKKQRLVTCIRCSSQKFNTSISFRLSSTDATTPGRSKPVCVLKIISKGIQKLMCISKQFSSLINCVVQILVWTFHKHAFIPVN